MWQACCSERFGDADGDANVGPVAIGKPYKIVRPALEDGGQRIERQCLAGEIVQAYVAFQNAVVAVEFIRPRSRETQPADQIAAQVALHDRTDAIGFFVRIEEIERQIVEPVAKGRIDRNPVVRPFGGTLDIEVEPPVAVNRVVDRQAVAEETAGRVDAWGGGRVAGKPASR